MMHPVIDEDTIKKLRGEADQAEQLGRLTDQQLAIIYKENWFKIFVPEQHNGLALDLLEGLRLEEMLAWIDGSLGWTVTLCSGATMFVGYLCPSLSTSLFDVKEVCFGGSGRAAGIATVTPTGYKINGEWAYATGAPHNTAFTANCMIEENGQPVLDELGQPKVRSFLFLAEEVTCINDWQTMGLKATASQSFKITDLKVPASRSFLIDANGAQLDQAIFRYPFLQFAETTLAVNTLGMARRFFECYEELFILKEGSETQSAEAKKFLKKAKEEMEQERMAFYHIVETSWRVLVDRGNIDNGLLEEVSMASRKLVKCLRTNVSSLYPYGGMTAAIFTTEINRIWRNIFTASQHSLLRIG